jgi:hypothetical protein
MPPSEPKENRQMRNTFLKVTTLNEMIALANAGLPAPGVCQYGYDAHNRPMVAFLATDQKTGKPLCDKNGNPRFNWRPGRQS